MNKQELCTKFLEDLINTKEGAAIRDLKLNFQKLSSSTELTDKEFSLLLIALGETLHFAQLTKLGEEIGLQENISQAEINETKQIPVIMGMLNTYYKYRFFIEKNDTLAAQEYGNPQLRMNSLAKPLIGKELFELISLCVSLLNSCEKCVTSHEKALIDLGISRIKIHEYIRISAVAKGISFI